MHKIQSSKVVVKMLHNTGTFGQKQVPINPNNQMNLTSQNDNISCNNNLAETGNEPPQTTHFNVPEYNTYGINMNTGLSQFHNTGLQTTTHTHESWPNNMLPMNLNVQNEQSLLTLHNLEKSETNVDYKGHSAKNTLNMPPVYTKAFHKQVNIDYNYFSNANYDLNHLNSKSSAKEQFVKQNLDLTAQSSAPSEAPSLNNFNEDNRISTNFTKTETENHGNNSTYTVNKESSYYELDLSNKPVHNVNTDSISSLSNKLLKDDSRKQLEKKVKMIENIISHPSNSRKIKIEQEKLKIEVTEDADFDLSDTSEPDFFSDSHKTSKSNNNVKLKKNKTKSPISNVSNKLGVTNKIKHTAIKSESLTINEDYGDGINKINKHNIKLEDGIIVKAEVVPAIFNIEQFNPFLRDTYGVHGEETKNCDIIGADSSINVAKEIIKNGASLKSAFFECPHCKLFFNNTKRFLIHTKWHTFGYITEKKLRAQKEKIVKPRNRKYKINNTNESNKNEESGTIPCADCKRTFHSNMSLQEHRRKYHPTRVRECKICAKTVVGMTALRTHIATHTTTESKFQCTDCPKWFKYAHSLAKHRDTHLEKTQECSQCPKKFGSLALLNVHMKTHERVLRGATFRCTYCAKGFFESYSLQAHERTHRNERPYICEICNTSFGTNSSLKRHLKVSHSTSKPYECSTCHRSFVSESIRDRHAIRYHGDPNEFKFVCKLCPCKYLNARELRRHIYKVHPKPKMKIEVESD